MYYSRALLGIVEYKIGHTYACEIMGERRVAMQIYPSQMFSLNKSDTVKSVTLAFYSMQ